MNREEVLSYLRSQKLFFASQFNIVKIGLFGSLARNEKPNDLDILVEFEPNTQFLFDKKFALGELLENKFHLPVDVCREKSLNPAIKEAIAAEVIFV
jgi:predicted nucleotidyltransferase